MHFDNLFFILLIAGAALLRWLAQKSKSESNNSNREESPPIFREPDETEEEKVRRFFDALGQPTSSKPQPRVTPRTDFPPRPVAPVQPPIHIPIGRPLFPSRQPTQAPREKRIFTPRVAPAATFEIREAAAPPVEPSALLKTPAEAYAVAIQTAEQVAEAPPDFAARLRSTYKLRDVIVLREIFGPPRGLQAPDLVGSV